MKAFTALYTALDSSTSTRAKIAALVGYFKKAQARDAAWAVFFLTGEKYPQAVPVKRIRVLACELAGVEDWLFSECYETVGDLAETVALLLPPGHKQSEASLADWVETRLAILRDLQEGAQRELLASAWDELDSTGRLVWNKLITGAFRVGVSQQLVIRALAEASGIDGKVIAHRLMGGWAPSEAAFRDLVASDPGDGDAGRPYPFFLAHPLENEPASLGARADWQAEWKWDGIRAQLIRRRGNIWLWSRGDELISAAFPDIVAEAQQLPDGTVLDGEILAWKDGEVAPFAALQRRLGRKQVGKKLLEDAPVALLAYDILELQGADVRSQPLQYRRERLEALLGDRPAQSRLRLSPLVAGHTWAELVATRQQSRARQVEGLMLKRRDSAYGVGRTRGDWWKWKIEPYTLDAVLIYAQRGHGRRASLYTDYTFGLWHEGELMPFAKAYSGLTDEEINRVDAYIRKNTVEKFGPVRTVKPELVFELAFEGIQRSTRHKSGLAVRFPRIARWRQDKKIDEANSLASAQRMLDKITPQHSSATAAEDKPSAIEPKMP
jgi:DNA ligase-1